MGDLSNESIRPWPEQSGEPNAQSEEVLILQPLDEAGGELPEDPDAILLMQVDPESSVEENTALAEAWWEEINAMPEEVRGLLNLGQKAVEGAQWAANHKLITALGLVVLTSSVVDSGGTANEILPVAGAVFVGEVLWIGGAAVALSALQDHVPRNWGEIRAAFSGIGETARSSFRFWGGVGINTIGAFIEAGFPVGYIVQHSPPEGWPKAIPFALDILATFAFRGIIINATRKKEP